MLNWAGMSAAAWIEWAFLIAVCTAAIAAAALFVSACLRAIAAGIWIGAKALAIVVMATAAGLVDATAFAVGLGRRWSFRVLRTSGGLRRHWFSRAGFSE